MYPWTLIWLDTTGVVSETLGTYKVTACAEGGKCYLYYTLATVGGDGTSVVKHVFETSPDGTTWYAFREDVTLTGANQSVVGQPLLIAPMAYVRVRTVISGTAITSRTSSIAIVCDRPVTWSEVT
jgi:hypothetical protein